MFKENKFPIIFVQIHLGASANRKICPSISSLGHYMKEALTLLQDGNPSTYLIAANGVENLVRS